MWKAWSRFASSGSSAASAAASAAAATGSRSSAVRAFATESLAATNANNNNNASGAIERIRDVVDAKDISVAEGVRDHHGHDESWHRGSTIPDAVVFPRSVAQVSDICRICNELSVPVVAYGTGTGLEGGVVALRGGVSVNLVNFSAEPEIREADFNARVGAGITRKSLNESLRGSGLFFPIDPGADASICGMAATNASGTNAVRYGTMKENVINLEVVLADGTVVHTAGENRHAKKSAAGYNLTNLFVGSEGTLGVITSATVRLHPLPAAVAAAVCSFPDDGAAVDSVVQILQCGIPVARVEFLDDVQMSASAAFSGLDLPARPTLFFEFVGADDEDVDKQAAMTKLVVDSNGGGDYSWAKETEDRNRLWKARHDAWYAARSLRPGAEGYSTDVCVPISRLPEVLRETKADICRSGLTAPIVGHVGDGNFHCLVMFDPENEEERRRLVDFTRRLVRRALDVGGTCTGEHSIGIGKREWVPIEFGAGAYSVMQTIKKALDPKDIMNPEKKILI